MITKKIDIIVLFIFSVAILFIEGIYLKFFFTTGLQLRSLSVPILFFLLLGVLIFALSAWNYTIRVPFSRLLKSNIIGGKTSLLIMARSSLLLFIYSLFIFLPLILVHGDALDSLYNLALTLKLEKVAIPFFSSLYPYIQSDIISKFVVTQLSGLTALLFASLIIRRRR